ncbi:Brix-domain-containing protein [Aureobasidium subglaciale]|nr:Brix-domain-containing protein [Aureobasidium subglaciale]
MVSRNPNKIGNKIKRKEQHVKVKRAKENEKRDDRLRRRRTEDKNPALREARRAKNVPQTIDRKRTWDTAGAGEEDDRLGLSVDLNAIKRRKVEDGEEEDQAEEEEEEEKDSDVDSMVDFDEEDEELDEDAKAAKQLKKDEEAAAKKTRAPSPTPSTAATNLSLTPEGLASKFPSLFENTGKDPKVLVTTSINSFLHEEAALLTSLFPNSVYIKRTAHFHAHKYSVAEISSFASNRNYTHVVILNEDQKKPKGLDIVHLPHGPMFHFSINNWVEGAKLPGHGNPTSHDPELILNNFRTPLGLLTAHLFRQIFPPQPQIQGRQVVTLHNQRDYIFVRRHRYVFRDKRATEKSIVGPDGKLVEGVEDIRAGLQELGPRFTLKLRRIDKGIQRRSGQEWEWKAGDEKVRTRFAL